MKLQGRGKEKSSCITLSKKEKSFYLKRFLAEHPVKEGEKVYEKEEGLKKNRALLKKEPGFVSVERGKKTNEIPFRIDEKREGEIQQWLPPRNNWKRVHADSRDSSSEKKVVETALHSTRRRGAQMVAKEGEKKKQPFSKKEGIVSFLLGKELLLCVEKRWVGKRHVGAQFFDKEGGGIDPAPSKPEQKREGHP